MKLWSCQEEWPGSVVFIICGGSSVAAQDLNLLHGQKVIAINSSVFAFPQADFLFFGDSRWWYHNQTLLKEYNGRIVTTTTAHTDPNRVLYMNKVKPPPGFIEKRDSLVMQYTSLQAAMNLAKHLGAKTIVPVGADNGPNKEGRIYHHKPHPDHWARRNETWDLQMANLALTVKPYRKNGIEIINASLQSRLPWWPKKELKECLTLSV